MRIATEDFYVFSLIERRAAIDQFSILLESAAKLFSAGTPNEISATS